MGQIGMWRTGILFGVLGLGLSHEHPPRLQKRERSILYHV